ncbi:MAG: hypothetical protein MN733_31605 [Nitrososphaera sp.]|nr:hypothetical protein [Nitrososphaera sp.]
MTTENAPWYVSDKDSVIVSLKNRIKELTDEIESLNRDLGEALDEVESLRSRLDNDPDTSYDMP